MNGINIDTLRKLMPEFQKFLDTEGQKWIAERSEKDKFFATYFTEPQIDQLEEGTLRELIHILWAFTGWTNKDYLLTEMLSSGLPTIRKAFKYLLYGDDPIAKRFDHVKEHVRMMGVASISEILSQTDHTIASCA